MVITFEGRVERVEGVCHVSVSISSHAFTGIPILRFTLVGQDLSFSRAHIAFPPRPDQLSDEFRQSFRGNYFANLKVEARLSRPMRGKEEVARPIRAESRDGAIVSCRAAQYH